MQLYPHGCSPLSFGFAKNVQRVRTDILATAHVKECNLQAAAGGSSKKSKLKSMSGIRLDAERDSITV